MKVEIKCQYTKLVNVNAVIPHDKNANKHPEKQVEILAKIIEYQGFRTPLVISNLSGKLVSGHGRLLAAHKLGMTEVPCDFQDFENEEQEIAHLYADNKIASMADHDDAFMIDTIKELDLGDMDFELFGMDNFEIPMEPDPAKEETEDAIPENVETRCKPGDLWILGNHRLLCGDSTNIQHVERLMGGEKADMVFTDPPYNYTPTNRGAGALGAQASKVGKKIEFISTFDPSAFLNTLSAIKAEPFAAYIFCNTELVRDYLNWAEAEKLNYNILAWHKTKFIPANSNHHYPDTEYCIFISKRPIFNSGLSPDHYRKYWIQDKDGNDLHPTMKPISIIERCLELNSKSSALDLFGGSGSTLIACEKTNRKCFMAEIDPHYCDVILKRWEDYSGKKAVLSNDQS